MKKEDCLIKVRERAGDRDGGTVAVHIRNIGPTDHATLCGLDVELAGNDHVKLHLEPGDKVTCGCCLTYYKNRAVLNACRWWVY